MSTDDERHTAALAATICTFIGMLDHDELRKVDRCVMDLLAAREKPHAVVGSWVRPEGAREFCLVEEVANGVLLCHCRHCIGTATKYEVADAASAQKACVTCARAWAAVIAGRERCVTPIIPTGITSGRGSSNAPHVPTGINDRSVGCGCDDIPSRHLDDDGHAPTCVMSTNRGARLEFDVIGEEP